MKKLFASLAFGCLVLIQASNLFADESNPPLIHVSANASVKAFPDLGKFTVQFRMAQAKPESARKAIDRSVDRFLSKIKQLVIDDKSLDTSDTRVVPQYRHQNQTRQLTGYEVIRTVRFTLKDLGQMGDAVRYVTTSDHAQLNPIQFDVSNPEQVKQRALNKALRKARNYASTIAKQYGATLGNLHTANYHAERSGGGHRMRSAQMEAFSAKSDSSTYQTGEIEFNAQVSVSFLHQ